MQRRLSSQCRHGHLQSRVSLTVLPRTVAPEAGVFNGIDLLVGPPCSLVPGLANLLTQTPGIRDLVKWIGGIAQERRMPPFAAQTFKDWYRRRPRRNTDQPKVILWADTFNNHFFPETAQAAVEVLEAAGQQVIVSQEALCCGRPLYDFGMLTLAKSLLRQILDALRPEIAAGTPVVGLEPSCIAVFRDELINLFPYDEDAKRLAQQTFTLAEFLEKKVGRRSKTALSQRLF